MEILITKNTSMADLKYYKKTYGDCNLIFSGIGYNIAIEISKMFYRM